MAWTQVTMADGTKKNIEDVEIWEKILWQDWFINTVIWYDRPTLWNRHLWSINGSEYFVSDEHPFKTTEWWKSFNPEMTKLEIDLNTTELKVWDILVTSNWLEEIKYVDYVSADYNTPLYNFVLDGNHTYYANGYLVHNKGPTEDPITKLYYDVECFDVNANELSYQQWEILPFYWNVSAIWRSGDINEFLYELTGFSYDEAKDAYWEYKWNACTWWQEWYIALNSMMCEYTIEDAMGKKVVANGEFPCFRDKGYKVDEPLLLDWMTKWKDRVFRDNGKTNFRTYNSDTIREYRFEGSDSREIVFRSNLNHVKNFWASATTFWEYKIKLSHIDYLQCEDGVWTGVSEKQVCSSDFTLTNPYTVQKTPSGNLKASTEALRNYIYCKKKDSSCGGVNDPDWSDAGELIGNALAASDYQQNEATENAMKNFIDKYSKLAVTADKKTWLKKVPGKNIYFVEKDLSIWPDFKVTNPTTIVQTNWNTTIQWNVDSNLMLLTKWSITFTDTDSHSCSNRQTVKWIFYAKDWVYRTPVTKNTNLNNSTWCTEWWLTIKWVLIWKGLDGMMKNSRSNLNNRFSSKTVKTVMDWASVIIEYSPSVFTKWTMPPGAEDFTSALSVYKN